jgi:hypothetical protein
MKSTDGEQMMIQLNSSASINSYVLVVWAWMGIGGRGLICMSGVWDGGSAWSFTSPSTGHRIRS